MLFTLPIGKEQEKVKHRFSEPWEDSDLILIVEDEKFHVHRLILSMNSPVFKAMFKSGFQEANNNEIQLPGKRGNEVLDFLKQFYIQEKEEITGKLLFHNFVRCPRPLNRGCPLNWGSA